MNNGETRLETEIERDRRKKNRNCHPSTLVCNDQLSESTAGNIDINALNDDKYFPVELSFHIITQLTKNNLSFSSSHQKREKRRM